MLHQIRNKLSNSEISHTESRELIKFNDYIVRYARKTFVISKKQEDSPSMTLETDNNNNSTDREIENLTWSLPSDLQKVINLHKF